MTDVALSDDLGGVGADGLGADGVVRRGRPRSVEADEDE